MSNQELSGGLRFDAPPSWSVATRTEVGAELVILTHEDPTLGASIVVTKAVVPEALVALGARALTERLGSALTADLEGVRRAPVRRAEAASGEAHTLVIEGALPGSGLTVRKVLFVWLDGAALITLTAEGPTDANGWKTLSDAADHVLESLRLHATA